MKNTWSGALVKAGLFLSLTLPCHAVSIVTNGSFENNGGVGELGQISFATGWTVGATTDGTPYPFVFIVDSDADSAGF
jgi:hypothetical protein